jgi:hypothetical protein
MKQGKRKEIGRKNRLIPGKTDQRERESFKKPQNHRIQPEECIRETQKTPGKPGFFVPRDYLDKCRPILNGRVEHA